MTYHDLSLLIMTYHGLSWLVMTYHDLSWLRTPPFSNHRHVGCSATASCFAAVHQWRCRGLQCDQLVSGLRVEATGEGCMELGWSVGKGPDYGDFHGKWSGTEAWWLKKMSNFFCSQDMSCLFLVFSPDESAYSKQHDHNIFTLLFVWVSLNLVVPHLHGPGRMRRRSWNGALTQWTPTFRCISASTRQNVGVTQRPLSWACS